MSAAGAMRVAFAGEALIDFTGSGGLAFQGHCGGSPLNAAVACARLGQATDAPGADFGATFAELYRKVCADWPHVDVPPAFYAVPVALSATLVLSGGADPVTPPRHGARVARALGAQALHVVVPQAGHGVMGLLCMRDVLYRFIDAADDALALKVDTACAAGIPRPPAFQPFSGGVAR